MKNSMDINAQSNPLQLFEQWMNEAKALGSIREPTAMSVATVAPDGDVHVRVVLCKDWSEQGFTFFTNYNSRKGQDLASNTNIGAVFYWDPMFRQIKISGSIEKVARETSVSYWRTRPRESQLSQYISRQSQPVESRAVLEEAWRQADREFTDREIPCPAHWGGYLIKPSSMEFWIGQPGRLHDRFVFKKSGARWTFNRLCP